MVKLIISATCMSVGQADSSVTIVVSQPDLISPAPDRFRGARWGEGSGHETITIYCTAQDIKIVTSVHSSYIYMSLRMAAAPHSAVYIYGPCTKGCSTTSLYTSPSSSSLLQACRCFRRSTCDRLLRIDEH